jgi:hypothetical protein
MRIILTNAKGLSSASTLNTDFVVRLTDPNSVENKPNEKAANFSMTPPAFRDTSKEILSPSKSEKKLRILQFLFSKQERTMANDRDGSV